MGVPRTEERVLECGRSTVFAGAASRVRAGGLASGSSATTVREEISRSCVVFMRSQLARGLDPSAQSHRHVHSCTSGSRILIGSKFGIPKSVQGPRQLSPCAILISFLNFERGEIRAKHARFDKPEDAIHGFAAARAAQSPRDRAARREDAARPRATLGSGRRGEPGSTAQRSDSCSECIRADAPESHTTVTGTTRLRALARGDGARGGLATRAWRA